MDMTLGMTQILISTTKVKLSERALLWFVPRNAYNDYSLGCKVANKLPACSKFDSLPRYSS